ncbi:MAG: long-chain fatty acid--CoA ligase [Planctomycetes bacterium]|nr:long-chain fatty acid--CoA ligase [Planctomycetota bacterium]
MATPTLSPDLARGFLEAAERSGDAPALFLEDHARGFGELASLVRAVAADLAARGVGPGDRVGLMLPNCETFVAGLFAILARGAAVVPINALLTPREASFMLRDAGARTLVTSALFAPHFAPLRQAMGGALEIADIFDVFRPGAPAPRAPEIELPAIAHDDEACILYTSGTTGRPKGVVLTQGNFLWNIWSVWEFLRLAERTGDRFVSALPMFHSFDMTVCIFAPLLRGIPVVVVSEFKPQKLLAAIVERRGSILLGVPPMFALTARLPIQGLDISSLRIVISGGAALPVAVGQAFERAFQIPIHEGYGLSEAAPVVAVNPIDRTPRVGSIGLPVPGVEIKIVDPAWRAVPDGTPGELLVRGGNVMKGYLNLPDETREVLRDGWLSTGDIAVREPDGYLRIVDRKKEMINVGGENVYPREIEEVLYRHPKIVAAAVVGVADRLRGESVKAYIELAPGETLTADDVIRHASESLAPFKVPRHVEFVASLPRTPTGKVEKKRLRELQGS